MDIHFLKNMPKIELHAHLNGSLKIDSIRELGMQLYGENNEQFLCKIKNFIEFPEDDDNNKLNKCFQKFQFMHELTSTKEGLQLTTEKVIRDFDSDNVIYLELRTTPKSNENMTRREYIEIILNTLQKCQNRYNIMVKLLVSIDRSQGPIVANEIVNLAIEMKCKYPNIVRGVDLSGNPTKGSFNEYTSVLEQAKQSGLKLALHCAEVKNEVETQEMLDFNFQRCGHGTFLTAEQIEQCKKQNITVECCLTSNVKCGTVKHYDLHHFKNLFENNVKVVICTDDCGVFDSTLTDELFIACKIYGLSKTNVYNLCLYAIHSSFTSDEEKYILRDKIETYFKNNNIV
ncbi:adenosine deaminase-like protein [Haematobia irritans]|uniref:adenosine deaminase-like protein n=1 Tax=Haematobia irritans TaxID=7368 RepID=UPI003F500507